MKFMFFVTWLLVFSALNPHFLLSQVPNGVITLISKIESGSNTYDDPYVIYTDTVAWRIDETDGPGKENATYMTDIHLARHRSCSQTIIFENLSWSNIVGRTFKWRAMAGIYYIKLSITHNGEEKFIRTFVQCKVPPIKPFTHPYEMPPGNQPSVPVIDIINTGSGSGSYGDPYIIDGPIVQFLVDNSYDPDGNDDIRYGVCYWAIYTEGNHPVYCKYESETDPAKTFLYYDEIQGTVYEWDTRKRPSTDNTYKLILCVMDQYGEQVEATVRFYYDPESGSVTRQLTVDPMNLDFGNSTATMSINIINAGSSDLSWSAETTKGQSWIKSLSPNSGSIAVNKYEKIDVTVDRSALADGTYDGTISVSSNGGNKTVNVFLEVNAAPLPPQNIQVVIP